MAANHPEKRNELVALLDEHEDWLAKNKIGAGEQALDDGMSNLSGTPTKTSKNLAISKGDIRPRETLIDIPSSVEYQRHEW